MVSDDVRPGQQWMSRSTRHTSRANLRKVLRVMGSGRVVLRPVYAMRGHPRDELISIMMPVFLATYRLHKDIRPS